MEKGLFSDNYFDSCHFVVLVALTLLARVSVADADCNCHNHSRVCNQTSGVCIDCQNNTTGDACEFCVDGYYGNATRGSTSDCNKCPCEPLKSSKSCVTDGGDKPRCLHCNTGYSGRYCSECDRNYFLSSPHGVCKPCNCSSYEDRTYLTLDHGICNNLTGACWKCLNDSAGQHCESCRHGYYKGDSFSPCLRCSCSGNGKKSDGEELCDPSNGYCTDCMFNTTGRWCERCADGFVGDAVFAKNCTRIRNAKRPGGDRVRFVLLGVLLSVFLASAVILGLCFRHRRNRSRVHRFYSVHMYDEDHLPEGYDQALDDVMSPSCIDTTPLTLGTLEVSSVLEVADHDVYDTPFLNHNPYDTENPDDSDDGDEENYILEVF